MTDTSSTLRIVWIYPDLLSTYGDQGNVLILRRRAELRGIRTETLHVHSSDPVPVEGDVYLVGGGEDRPQILAAERLRADGGLKRAADRGAAVFAVCAGYQIIGESYGDDADNPLPGVGILDVRSSRGATRAVGEIVADVVPELGVGRITGFENHQGRTAIGPSARPLSTTVKGIGNDDATEGAYQGQVLGTYLHGPALPRNPALADLLLRWRVGEIAPLQPSWGEKLHEERLAAAL
ncbi:type 1 glutamine amidotransferase [Nocardiopsis ansamitocini]|uniref:Lipid II isoglutaminyl synthase (glutamine-hydrolyzing) subunit GatD n=1 Tax=Nocardiopsis ansamitocini TaxID=1670832 RepID=A0A9W6P907_9ACTN|nr:glutamine amidotransferase [Nocardiopsis ansamitocini]GLU49206.1 glutamine amidotransferase [Nocardiopsis ansamitocini]